MKKQLTLLVSLLLVATLLFGCGAESAGYKDSAMEEMGATVSDQLSGGNTVATPQADGQKLVRKLRLSAETEDLDALLTAVDAKISELEGYVEERDVYNGSRYSGARYRSATMIIRIPAKSVDQFVNHMTDNANIVSSSENVENITLSYVDTQSRVAALETEQARLLELLAKAETMEDLLTIEKRLTDVRTELESVASQLRLYENMVDYATVNLDIDEVREYTVTEEPVTVWDRIVTGFVASLENIGDFFVELFIFVIVASPYLLLIAGIVVGIIFLCRRSRKKRLAKKAKQEKTE